MISADWHTILILVTAILYLVAAILALTRRSYRPNAAAFMAVYALISCGWTISQLFRLSDDQFILSDNPPDRLPWYGLPLLAMVFLYLSRAFLHSQSSGRTWKILSVIWLVSVGALEALFWSSLSIPTTSLQILLITICGLGWIVFTGGSLSLTLQKLRPQVAPRYQTAATYWVLVVALTIAGDILFVTSVTMAGNILRLAGALLAVALIVQSRLSSMATILRRSLSYTIYLVLALAIYTIGLALMMLGLQYFSGLSLIVIGLLLAIPLVIVFTPLINWLRDEIKTWFTRDEGDPTIALRQYSKAITNILDLNLLATLSIGTAVQVLKIDHGALFLVDPIDGEGDQGYYFLRGVEGTGVDQPVSAKIRSQCALATALQEGPVTQTEIDFQSRFKDMSPDEHAWISGLDAEVYVPIFSKNEWIGLLTLGPKHSGDAYSEHDLFLLGTMSDQTAVALENTRLVEGLVRLNREFKRSYAALEQSNRHLERLDRTKSDFISIASHELRTPLTLIRGSNQMLLDESTLREDPYYNQLISKIEKGTERLNQIIDSLLDVAKIDTRALALETQTISLQELIDQVHRSLKPVAIERKQTITIEHLDHLPTITADGEALRKVFHHLLINAIKFTPDGGEISISGRELRPMDCEWPEGGVEISIKDTGIGIDPRYQELIFAKFYQTGEPALHSSSNSKFKGGGPGLGLAIAHGIVDAHHGKVWAESPGHDEEDCPGSTFYVLLPISQNSFRTLPLGEIPVI